MPDTHHSASVQQVELQPIGQETFLASVLVPRAASSRDITALETAMQGLAQDDRHPVALELAATATSRAFLLRATSATALAHLCSQVQARYPQAVIGPVAEARDPLRLHEGEEVSAVELCAGAAAYLPLRTFRERAWQQEGADPLLGILGTFNHLPSHMRVVSQLALLPASPTWSGPYLRKAVEHPLEQEHLRTRLATGGRGASEPGTVQLVGLGVLVALLLVWWRLQKQIEAHLPRWVVQAGLSLLHGKTPRLSPAQVSLLLIAGVVTFIVLLGLAFLLLQMQSRFGGTSLYDRRLVEEKTARPAYRVCLRLFVVSACTDGRAPAQSPPWRVLVRRLVQWPPDTQSWVHTARSFRVAMQIRAQERAVRGEVLSQVAAAYRQYHTATGGYFVPRPVSPRTVRRLLATPERTPARVGERRGPLVSPAQRGRPGGALALAASSRPGRPALPGARPRP